MTGENRSHETSGSPRSLSTTPVPASDREIVTTRVFDAPRELVFKAWTDLQYIGQW